MTSQRVGPLRPAFELWALLLTVWTGLLVIAAAPEPKLFGRALVASELTRLFHRATVTPIPTPTPLSAPHAAYLATAPAPSTSAPEATPQRILMLGDSMLDGLLPRLADYAADNGHSLSAVIWYGSRTIDWARGERLREALRDYQPSFVFVVVGSSELTTRDVEKRARAVQQILEQIAPRKLIWIGPPNWRTDTGIGALLERELGEGRYFRSLELKLERKRDGIHPTLAASQLWMDSVASWVMTRSAAPIRLEPPRTTGAPRPRARVFAPPSP